MLRYGLGLDIGVTLIGWAVLSLDHNDEPNGIVDLNVRMFPGIKMDKKNQFVSKQRRLYRGQRRRNRRKAHRIERAEKLMVRQGLIELDSFKKRYETKGLPDIYELRYAALDRLLSNDELAQILVYMVKHRGFRSNRKSELKESDMGNMLTGLEENKQLLQDKGYRTVGEMIYLDEKFKKTAYGSGSDYYRSARNKNGEYTYSFKRELLVEETKKILRAQREFGNTLADESFEAEYLSIMESQRSYDEGPGGNSRYGGNIIEKMIGECIFFSEEKRAAKATYTAERFLLLSSVNHTVIMDDYGNARFLSQEEREKVIGLAYRKNKVTYKDVREETGLRTDEHFKGLDYDDEKAEKKTFIQLKYWHDIKKILKFRADHISDKDIEQLDKIGTILSAWKTDNTRNQEFDKLQIENNQLEELLKLNYSGFVRLSLRAIRMILPYMEQGLVYSEACERAGLNFNNSEIQRQDIKLKGEHIYKKISEITNPIVKRAVSQTVKLINAIIDAYGSPVFIRIELARELSKNETEKKSIAKQNNENRKENERAVEEIKKLGIEFPSGQDIIKYRLWKKQDGHDYYTGKSIPMERLFEQGMYEIDHIFPYSRSCDNSFINKVVTVTKANRDKGNRTPHEWLTSRDSGGYQTWDNFYVYVKQHEKSYQRRQHLLKETYGADEEKAFTERHLSDTRYITVAVKELISHNLKFEPYMDSGKKQHVFCVNGAITAYLRKRWQLEKNRDENDKHHAQDAVVIACATAGFIQKITEYAKDMEVRYSDQKVILDVETGELISPRQYAKEKWEYRFKRLFPEPWPVFRKELEMRMSDHPEQYLKDLQKSGYEVPADYLRVHHTEDEILKQLGLWTGTVSPFFISRLSDRKTNRIATKDTIYSPKLFDEGKIIQKIELQNLPFTNGEIGDKKTEYYRKEDDRLLYDALVERLKKYNGDAKKAFSEPFYKPKSDGSRGPVVKKVKMVSTKNNGLYVNNGQGVAENGEMIRVDLFKKDGKFYMVPIYVSYLTQKILPNRAVAIKKPISQWPEMEETDFIFCLYQYDLVYIEERNGEKCLNYFKGANSCNANITIFSHDKAVSKDRSIQNLKKIIKYQSDMLGNLSRVKETIRQNI